MTDDEIIREIGKVLNDWNPLGENVKRISDLNSYDTEANDIFYFYDDDFQFPKYKDKKTKVQKVVKTIINDAFNLDLTDDDCKIPSEKIFKLLYDTKI
jgi:hypothetical protein